MSRKCKILGIILLILGIIGSILMAYEYGVTIKTEYRSSYYDYKIVSKRDAGLTFAILISGIVSSYIIYVIFQALGEILEQLAAIKNDDIVVIANTNEILQQQQNVVKTEATTDGAQELYNDLPEL